MQKNKLKCIKKTFLIAVLLSSLSITCLATSQSGSLYVFVPTDTRANILQDHISSRCPDIDTLVFGRAKDFQKELKKSPPDAVISLLPVINSNPDLVAFARGSKSGKYEEAYVLLSVDKPVIVRDLGAARLGVVDLLGRKPMQEFISSLFSADIKIKRVTKQEDLLPLLSFGSVQAILISGSAFQSIRDKSNLNLVPTDVNIKLGLASAAMHTTAMNSNSSVNEEIASCIASFDSTLNNMLGVDEWKTL